MTTRIDHTKTIEKIEIIDKWLLIKLAVDATSKKDIYLRNSIAKSISLLKSINSEYLRESINEGWILYRSLIDRLVYIYYLKEYDKFDEFENWTFIKQYEHTNMARADERFRQVLNDNNFKISREESNRYSALKKKNIKWTKPDPMTILKSKGLDFLYKFGYDFSSMHTHPMSTDGQFEFYSLTGLEPNPYKSFDNENLIKNSILVKTLIQQEIFNFMSFNFLTILYNFLDQVREHTNGFETELDMTFYKILNLIENNVNLCEKKNSA
jgi:hypothetical protein